MPSAIEVFNREVQFNYAAFIDMICSQKECVIKNYYIGSVSERSYPNANKSYLRNLRNNEQILDQHLSAHGLTVVKQPMVYDAGGFKQKGVDAHLTCDMLDDARDNKYDEAVLISSDRDFIPLIQRVREHGKKTIVIGFDVKQPFRLMEVADYNIILNDHLLSSYVSLPESQVKTIFKSANNPASSKEVQGVSAPCAAAGI